MKHVDQKSFLKTNIRKPLVGALLLAGIASIQGAEAALQNGYTLGITAGSNSWFGMLLNPGFETQTSLTTTNGIIYSRDRGMILGTAQPLNGAVSHTGNPWGGTYTTDVGAIDFNWLFFSNTGLDFTATPANVSSASGNTATVDLSGWRVSWNGVASINMGSSAWNGATNLATYSGMTNGVAKVTCAAGCLHGDTYSLVYTATVPYDGQTSFGGVKYSLHLAGTVSAPKPVVSGASITAAVSTLKAWTPAVNDSNSSCSILAQPSHGTATVASNCSSGTYTPTAAYVGSDSFTYVADNSVSGSGNTSTAATISVTVSATPPPTANADSATTSGTTAVAVDVLSNDTAGTSAINAATVITTAAGHGATSVNGTTGVVTYTASSGFSGTDTFQYTVQDTGARTSNAATVSVAVRATAPTSSSGTFGPGTTAAAHASITGGGLTTSDVGTDSDLSQQCVGGCFDFQVTGVGSGGTTKVVLPLSAAIPDAASYRKLINGTWQNFATTGGNAIASAAATSTSPLTCPEAGSSTYSAGLTAGYRCIQLTIVDGGANDGDSLTNGTVLDPSGVGVLGLGAETRTSSTKSGCSLSTHRVDFTERGDWWLVLGFIAWLGTVIRRRQNHV